MIRRTVKRVPIDADKTHVALAVIAEKPEILLRFDELKDYQVNRGNVVKRLRQVKTQPYPGDIVQALTKARELFTPDKGSRADAVKVRGLEFCWVHAFYLAFAQGFFFYFCGRLRWWLVGSVHVTFPRHLWKAYVKPPLRGSCFIKQRFLCCLSFIYLALLCMLCFLYSALLCSLSFCFAGALLYCTVLYCTVLYCTALHCTALHCTALHCTALHCTALHCTALHCTVLYCTVLHCTVLYCTVLYCTALHCTALHCTVLHCTALYCTALHCTALYCTALYCTVLYCTVLYCTVLCYVSSLDAHFSYFAILLHWHMLWRYVTVIINQEFLVPLYLCRSWSCLAMVQPKISTDWKTSSARSKKTEWLSRRLALETSTISKNTTCSP